MMKESRLLAAACVFISTLCLSTNAAALLIEYTVGTYDATGVGNAKSPPTNFNEIHLFETTQSFDLTEDVPTQGLLNTGEFVVGSTSGVGLTTELTASRSFDLTVGSDIYNSGISQLYSVLIGNTQDSLAFIAGSTVTIDLGTNGLLDITPNSVATTPYPGGTHAISINGTFLLHDVPAVPIPAAVWLFGSGLLGLVGMARRKNSA